MSKGQSFPPGFSSKREFLKRNLKNLICKAFQITVCSDRKSFHQAFSDLHWCLHTCISLFLISKLVKLL